MICPRCSRYGPPDPETGYDADELCPDCKEVEMEAEFYWCLAKPPEAKRIDVAAPGLFLIHMQRAFPGGNTNGEGWSVELSEKDLDTLNGMASTWSDVSVSPYVILIAAIKRYKKAIKVYVSYGENDQDVLRVPADTDKKV